MVVEISNSLHINRDVAALIVSSVVAYGLAAGAETRNGHSYSEDELVLPTIDCGIKGAFVVHQGTRVADRGPPLQKIRENKMNVRTFSVKLPSQISKDSRNRAHRYLASMLIENLNEATHVSALEFVWQIDRHF